VAVSLRPHPRRTRGWLDGFGGSLTAPGIDTARARELKAREDGRFERTHPRSLELLERARASMPNGVPMQWFFASYAHPPLFVADGSGSRFRDVDGNEYADFNIADMSMFCGYAPDPLVRAVTERVAAGSQFLLPTEDAVWVAEELGRRWELPAWQFTLSASQANVELIRVARVATGRPKVLLFDGKYHGHFDDALVELDDGRLVPEELGLPPDVTAHTVVVPFNDAGALERALSAGDVAVVLAEPAMTNNHGLILPEPGFHEDLRRLSAGAGTLLAYDETHTLVCGPGGLVHRWSLAPDIVSIGKSAAGGIPMGAYGMTETVAAVFEHADHPDDREEAPSVATGGTLFANALSMAAARAALGEVLTDDAYEHTAALGAGLADGLEAVLRDAGLPWTVHRLFARSGVTFGPSMPTTAEEARGFEDRLLTNLARVYLANRGVWEAIPGAGPTVPVPATARDVDAYVSAYGELVDELTS
jgi:glutamate-1-semialdehyde 2,1-aminomutase